MIPRMTGEDLLPGDEVTYWITGSKNGKKTLFHTDSRTIKENDPMLTVKMPLVDMDFIEVKREGVVIFAYTD